MDGLGVEGLGLLAVERLLEREQAEGREEPSRTIGEKPLRTMLPIGGRPPL